MFSNNWRHPVIFLKHFCGAWELFIYYRDGNGRTETREMSFRKGEIIVIDGNII